MIRKIINNLDHIFGWTAGILLLIGMCLMAAGVRP
jgi:hypothetical protein